jgi:sugar lactone lactonase YvrE
VISTRLLGVVLAVSTATLVACAGGATIGSAPGPIGATSPAPGTSASPKPGTSATPSPTPTPTVAPTAAPTASGSPNASGTALPAGEKIYVVNHGLLGDSPSVTIYPVAATGAATPLATIAGNNTLIAQPFFDVVDAKGTLYVSNQSQNPGSQTAGYVTEYDAANQSGNVSPSRTITGLHNPEGLGLDSAGNLYVAVVDAIDVFAPGASGNATPIRVIGGATTTLQNLFLGGQPAGIALDTAGDVFVTQGPVILEFAPGASGNVAPTNIYGGVNGGNPATTGPPYGSATLASALGIAVDSAGNLYAANFNNSSFAVFTSPTLPGLTVESLTASEPVGIWVDTAGQIYVANYKSSTVQVFSSMTTFVAGVASATISGTGTNLNYPYGVYAR